MSTLRNDSSRMVPLGVVAKVKSGFAFKSSRWTSSGVPVVKIANIKRGRLDLRGLVSCVTEEDAIAASRYRLHRGEILVGMTGYVGEVARVATDEHLLLNQRVGRVLPNSEGLVRNDFLYFALFSPSFREQAISLASGSAQANVSPAQLESIQIPLPPLEEQERIAGVLGAFDDLIETNRRLAQDATVLQRAAFLRATEGLPRVPISEVMQVEMGQSPPGDTYNYDGDGLPFFQGVKDFGDRYPTIRVYCSQPRRIAEPGDILLAIRAPIGRVNIATERCATGRGLAILCSALPAIALQSLTAQADLWAAYEDEGTVFSSINRKVISDQRIRWTSDPDLAEALEALDGLILDCHEQNSALTRQRDDLLPLLLSGQVRVRDVEAAVS